MGGIAKEHLVGVQLNPFGAQTTRQVSPHAGGQQLGQGNPDNRGHTERRGTDPVMSPWRYRRQAQAGAQDQQDQRQRSCSRCTSKYRAP